MFIIRDKNKNVHKVTIGTRNVLGGVRNFGS